jgi:hypothetical protein
MAIPSLSGSYIDQTYQRLVQVTGSGTEFADGLGNPITFGGAPFPFTGNAVITGSLVVTGSTTSTLGFTGSLFGTASWAQNVVTSSLTGSFVTIGTNQTITGAKTFQRTVSSSTPYYFNVTTNALNSGDAGDGGRRE